MSRDTLYFFLGPALTLVLCLFGAGLVIRNLTFLSHIIKNGRMSGYTEFKKGSHAMKMMATAFLPFHKEMLNKPIYTVVRYIFHACLFIVPICETGHVIQLQARFGWHWWPTLPGTVIEIMVFLVMGTGLFFICRRVVNPEVRRFSSLKDIVIILMTIAPFITGYWYANGTLNTFPLLGENMLLFHVLTGEAILVMIVFLFVRIRLMDSECVGCSSCTISCPTGTLGAKEMGNRRSFFYSHYQCICCGACVATCPENAVMLRHQINLQYFFSFFRKLKIREKELIKCMGCNELFAPDRQMQKIQDKIETYGIELPQTLNYCIRCKKLFSTGSLCRMGKLYHVKG